MAPPKGVKNPNMARWGNANALKIGLYADLSKSLRHTELVCAGVEHRLAKKIVTRIFARRKGNQHD